MTLEPNSYFRCVLRKSQDNLPFSLAVDVSVTTIEQELLFSTIAIGTKVKTPLIIANSAPEIFAVKNLNSVQI